MAVKLYRYWWTNSNQGDFYICDYCHQSELSDDDRDALVLIGTVGITSPHECDICAYDRTMGGGRWKAQEEAK